MQRRDLVALLAGGALAWPRAAHPQQRPKVPIIGALWHAENAEGEPGRLEALRAGLNDQGYVDGGNIRIIDTYAAEQYERFYTNAVELTKIPVDVLVALTKAAAVGAQRATTTIPIVFISVPDPVGSGLVPNLARPGRNITGFANIGIDISGKKLDMLRELTGATRFGLLLNGNDQEIANQSRATFQASAVALNVELHVSEVVTPDEIDTAFDSFVNQKVGGVVLQVDPMLFNERKRIARLGITLRLPTLGHVEELADDGVLMTYGASVVLMMRRAGNYVGRILKGTPPGELPVEQPTKIDLVVNLKTAQAIGLTIPRSLLLFADRVIE
jgi:putative ABC transport system substrate-binding protein